MRVNVKVEQGATLAFTRDLSYFTFTHVKITRQRKSTLIHTSPFLQTHTNYALAVLALGKVDTFTLKRLYKFFS